MTPRASQSPPQQPSARQPSRREQGVALLLVLGVIAVITVFVAELSGNASTALQVAVTDRDRIQAEYLARSGLNMTRLLIAKEPDIRKVVAPIYSMMLGHGPPQLNVWNFADQLLMPFANPKASAGELSKQSGIDFSQMQGIVTIAGTFEVISIPENSMINMNKPLFWQGDEARTSLAMQLYALTGGYQNQSPYDALFNKPDPDGQLTSRLDIVSDVIDWWDEDEQRTVFDPGASRVQSSGSEDDIYARYSEPYRVKNSAYDSLDELRLVRGFTDDFWATFVEPDPDDPRTRQLTIYGSGAVNPNESRAEVLWSRVCSFVSNQPLCQDPLQRQAFVQLFMTARAILPIGIFATPLDFLNFIEGKGGPRDLYPMLQMLLGKDNPLIKWVPVQIPNDKRQLMTGAFVTSARIFTIQAVGKVGKSSIRLNTVVNFDENWTPPPLTIGKMTGLGLFHRYRVD
jgi:general secretion pathway protein K